MIKNIKKNSICFLAVLTLVLLFSQLQAFGATPMASLYELQQELRPPHPDLIDRSKKDGVLQQLINEQQRRFKKSSSNQLIEKRLFFNKGFKSSPVVPKANALVLCVQFSDTAPQHTVAEFQNLLFGDSYGSLKDYYLKNSNGSFNLNGTAVGGDNSGTKQGTVFINLPQPKAYYVDNQNGQGSYPKNLQGIVADAVNLLIAANFDFTPYVSDGTIPYLFIIATGNDAAYTGKNTDIWSLQWALNENQVTVNINGGTAKVNLFCIQPELNKDGNALTTVGVYCHEFGHVLGLMDLYDTVNQSDSNGDGNWTVMASGCDNGPANDGSVPSGLDPFSKIFLGWLNPSSISGASVSQTIAPVENSYDQVYKISQATNQSEYFLLENRQKTGYGQYLPGHGLLIWHIDSNLVDPNGSHWSSNDINSKSNGHYGVDLIEADGKNELFNGANRGDGGDPFPGTSGVVSIADNTTPSSKFFNGLESKISLANISESNQNINLIVSTETSVSYQVSGKMSTGDGAGIPGVTMLFSVTAGSGTAPASVTTDTGGNWSQTGLQTGSTYRVTPTMSGYTFTPAYLDFSSASTTLNFTGTNSTLTAAITSVTLSGSSGDLSVGSSATFTATAAGATSQTKYSFWVRDEKGAWRTCSDFTTNNTCTLSNLQGGTYVVMAYASNNVDPPVASNKVYLKVGSSGTLNLSYQNGQITARATPTNVNFPLYDWWVQYPNGTWASVKGHFVTDATCVISATAQGTYTVVANITDLDFYEILGTSAWNEHTYAHVEQVYTISTTGN